MKISIIMPSYNQGRFVEAALRSALDQDYPDKEVLFLDGGSRDETMAIAERYRDRLAYCVSERDDGQSDALRKGFERASGQILTWLNTDDILLPGALSEVAQTFARHKDCEWVLGNVVWIDAGGTILRCRRGEGYSSLETRLGVLTACGPSAFFTQDLYQRVSGINLDLNYMMDTELWWRFAMAGAKFHRLRRYAWALRLHEDAKMSGHIFAESSDPAQIKVARAKDAERAHIWRLTQGHRMQRAGAFARPVSLARRACSPHYLLGRYESRLWRGRPLDEFMEAQCGR